MNHLQSLTSIIQKLYSMGVQEHSKFTLSEILNQQNPDLATVMYLLAFHRELKVLLDQKDPDWFARTHHRGLSYMCNDHKAFIYLDIRKHHLSLAFFTGNQQIPGLIKGNWSRATDNLGCKRFIVIDDNTLKLAVKFALDSYRIADNW